MSIFRSGHLPRLLHTIRRGLPRFLELYESRLAAESALFPGILDLLQGVQLYSLEFDCVCIPRASVWLSAIPLTIGTRPFGISLPCL